MKFPCSHLVAQHFWQKTLHLHWTKVHPAPKYNHCTKLWKGEEKGIKFHQPESQMQMLKTLWAKFILEGYLLPLKRLRWNLRPSLKPLLSWTSTPAHTKIQTCTTMGWWLVCLAATSWKWAGPCLEAYRRAACSPQHASSPTTPSTQLTQYFHGVA